LYIIVSILCDCALESPLCIFEHCSEMTFDMHPWNILHNDLFLTIWMRIVSVIFCINLNKFSIVEIFLLQLLCCSWGISHDFLCKYELFITNFWNTPIKFKTNMLPIVMHQMRISTTQVSSVMLRSKKLEIRKKITFFLTVQFIFVIQSKYWST
jgi:hypothetical protein